MFAPVKMDTIDQISKAIASLEATLNISMLSRSDDFF